MRIGFVIFEGMTALDFIGVYDPLTRLKTMGFMPELTWERCCYTEQAGERRPIAVPWPIWQIMPQKCSMNALWMKATSSPPEG